MVVSVIDANVLVSAIFGGVPLDCVEEAFRHRVCYTKAMEQELLGLPIKLMKKLSAQRVLSFRHSMRVLLAHGSQVQTKQSVRCCRDPKDNAYLEACLAARADFLITGDKDLLEISSATLRKVGLRSLRIVTPKQFVVTLTKTKI